MPNLEQIQNFLKYRRFTMGDNANMEGVLSFIETHKCHPEIGENEILFFGCENSTDLGNGTDERKLRLGFTSKKLYIEISNSFYHIDLYHIDLILFIILIIINYLSF